MLTWYVENYIRKSGNSWFSMINEMLVHLVFDACPSSILIVEMLLLIVIFSTGTSCSVGQDCFFVSVVVRNRPELVGKPVAVCHSEKTQGTAEISSSNYAARTFGMFIMLSCIFHHT